MPEAKDITAVEDLVSRKAILNWLEDRTSLPDAFAMLGIVSCVRDYIADLPTAVGTWHTKPPEEAGVIGLVRTEGNIHIAEWDGCRDWHCRLSNGKLSGTLTSVVAWTHLPGFVSLP